MSLPYFPVKNILSIPPLIHPNLMDRVSIRGRTYLIKGNFQGPWSLAEQREGLNQCLFKALNLRVARYFEHSNSGFLYAYPMKEGAQDLTLKGRQEIPIFSKLCWFPVKREELLFLLNLSEEGKKPGVVSIIGPQGIGKSYLIRRAVSLHDNSVLLNLSHEKLEKHLGWVLKNGPWGLIGLENYHGQRARDAFKILLSSFPGATFLLEGEEDGAFRMEVSPIPPEEWKEKLIFLDEETREKVIPLIEGGITPGQLILALMGKRPGEFREKTQQKPLRRRKYYLKEKEIEKSLSLGKRKQALLLAKNCRTRPCSAIRAFLEGKNFNPSERDPALAYLWAGKIQERMGNTLLAEAYYKEAYRRGLAELDGETAGRAFSDLGALFFRAGNLNEAEGFFRRSLTLLSSWGSEKAYTISAFNLAEVFFLKGEWEKAERLYRLSYRKSLREKQGLSHGYDALSLGYLLYLKGKKEEGLRLLGEAEEILLKAGGEEEKEDLAWKAAEISIEESRPILQKSLPHPYSSVESFLREGKVGEGKDPWSLLLLGLKFRKKTVLLASYRKFASAHRQDLAHWVVYLMAKEELWSRSDLPRIRKALLWYRARGCFRQKFLSRFLTPKDGEKKPPSSEEEKVLSWLSERARETWGERPHAFLIFSGGEILVKRLSPPIPWLLLRRHTGPELINSLEELKDQEEKRDAFLTGARSFILSSAEFRLGRLLGFVSSPQEGWFSETDLELLSQLLERASRAIKPKESFLLLKGRSPAMVKLYSRIKKAAAIPDPVMIKGETGTGKELVARSISTLYGGNFVVLNCAAIPSELLESELFGYKRGAFTGALGDKKGLIEEAHGGILFLDEVGEMPLGLQAKLLRVLQDGKFRRLGDTKERVSSFKLISATNRNLKHETEAGRFRRDLYHRISQFVIEIPPLRERPEDIILLSEDFASRYSGKRVEISSSLKKILLSYPWPGNVRELQGVIKYAAAMLEEGERTLLPQHLPPEFQVKHEFLPLEEARALWEEDYIRRALEVTSGDVTKAAALLGISRQYLHRLIRKYRIR